MGLVIQYGQRGVSLACGESSGQRLCALLADLPVVVLQALDEHGKDVPNTEMRQRGRRVRPDKRVIL